MHPFVNIGIRAARKAGDIILRHVDRAPQLDVNTKSRNDFVSEVDRKCEGAIIDTIRTAYPGHAILAEESGRHDGAEYEWVIDPLDGTTNFLHGFPQFAVSIACKHKGDLAHGIVYDPLRQELFTASRGSGAVLNDRKIRVSKQRTLEGALVGTGFPFRENANIDRYMSGLKALMQTTAGVRRAGAASLDLAYVACGRLDAFWEYGLKEWDVAAGALLILEAGGMVSEPDGGERYLQTGNILAATPKLMDALLVSFRS
ncbi:MAG: Inositol-1-monophosphatase [Gammaproteobacteria bacterium]|nr:Inositol-1-monophosphatase [Gammaproteobacteria bacterium]